MKYIIMTLLMFGVTVNAETECKKLATSYYMGCMDMQYYVNLTNLVPKKELPGLTAYCKEHRNLQLKRCIESK